MYNIIKYFTILLTIFILTNCGNNKNFGKTPNKEPQPPTEQSEYIDHPVMDKIRQRINDSLSNTITDVKFFTVGDSKRDGFKALDRIHYTRTFKKFNIEYVHNASSSITTEDWLNNVYLKSENENPNGYHSGLQTLIDNASGDKGAHTIIEFSLGTNDLNKYIREHTTGYDPKPPPKAEQLTFLKKELNKGIDTIQAKLPKALIFMAEATGIEAPILKQALLEVSKAQDLPLIKGLLDYKDKQALQSKFFVDDQHPSSFGSTKIIQNTLRHITEGNARALVKYDTPLYANPPLAKISTNLAQGIPIMKRFRLNENSYVESDEYRSITINVKDSADTVMTIKHPGNKKDVYFLAKDGQGILHKGKDSKDSSGALSPLREFTGKGKDTGVFYIHIPKETEEMVINMSYNESDFDTKVNDTPIEVRYMPQDTIDTKMPTQEEMNEGLLQ